MSDPLSTSMGVGFRRVAGAVAALSLLIALGLGGPNSGFTGAERNPGLDDFQRIVRPFLEAHCVECHSGADPEAELDLSAFDSSQSILSAPADWSLIQEVLEFDEMPPRGRPRPGEAERDAVLDWIGEALGGGAPPEGPLDPGSPVLRRLNHVEYENTIRDLFGVDFPAREVLAADGVGHGFDTVGEALSIPDVLFEQYLNAAERIANEAVRIDDTKPLRVKHYDASKGLEGRLRGNSIFLTTRGEVPATHAFPRSSRYRLRVSTWGQQAGPDPVRVALLLDGRSLETFDVEAVQGAAEVIEVEVEVPQGRHTVAARFTNDYYAPEAEDPAERDRNMGVEWIEVVGPLDPPLPSRFQGELLARFGEDLGRKRLGALLGDLVPRVWRREVDARELAKIERALPEEGPIEARLRFAIELLLASPWFLFKVELDPAGAEGTRELNDHELATRLSYFLWSTTPDDQLLELARRGTLRDPEVYAAEVERLLEDPRSRALADNFAAQWLQLRPLADMRMDPERFPDFDEELRDAMEEETRAFFDHLLRTNAPVTELIEADYTFVEARLAEHYGLEGEYGDRFQRASLRDTPRRGVLGQAAMLTVTSDPTRTSPVKRGRWILDVLLGAPPPAPPPGVDSLDEDPAAITAASLRERLEQHRADPACSVCHETMDPLGFGLEVFDATGALRERDGEFEIDARGTLPDGSSFEGPLGLVAILGKDDALARAAAERLFVYALGRGLEGDDRWAIQRILEGRDPGDQEAGGLGFGGPRFGNLGFGDLVRGVASSDAFLRRRVVR